MNREDFTALMGKTFEELRRINETKGHDYADDEDALSNFKDGAQRLGISPLQVWWVYADKHWDAITTFCRNGEVKSEAIEGRIHDLLLYGFLLLGLVTEKKQSMAKYAGVRGLND